MSIRLHAEKRSRLNPSGLRKLRQSGRLPAVIFTKTAENHMIHISAIEFQKWLRQGASGFIEMKMEDDHSLTVLLEDYQRHPISRELLHVDFQMVKQDEMLRTKIPIKFKGTPHGTKQGGIVQIQRSYLEVEALPKDLQSEIEFDISGLNIGESVFVKDLPLPSNLVIVSEMNELLLSVVK